MGKPFTILIVLVSLLIAYLIIKWAVKNGIKEAYEDITGKETYEDIKNKEIFNEIKNGLTEVKNKRKQK